ncbi:MAG: phosphatidate cytidylyltransferase [Bdellovibrionales bacterium]
MSEQSLWLDRIFVQTAVIMLSFLAVLTVFTFLLRNRLAAFTAGWASLKSWIFVAPLIFVGLALPDPWPLVGLTMVGIFSAKVFFQMVGIYHRSWFVWATYLFIFGLGYLVYVDNLELYNLSPMVFLGTIALIPLIRNSATNMIQYVALSLLSFIFWGWSLMHLGHLLMLERGPLIVLYLYILTEVSDNAALASSRLFGKHKLFDKISHRVTLEGLVISTIVALLVAWGFRHLLPDRSEKFWIAAGLIAAFVGRLGGLILSVIRRDLGIKNTGVFIIGRDDILSRTDKLIFVGPMYFYLYLWLQQVPWL